MNRQSVFFKLNILFIIALIATLVAGSSILVHIVKKDKVDILVKSRLIMNEYRESQANPTHLLKEFHLQVVDPNERRKVLHEVRKYPIEHIEFGKRSTVMSYRGRIYLHIHTHHINVLLRDERSLWDRFALPILIISGTVIILILMYGLLRSTLTPLKQLQKHIEYYGEGKLSEYTPSNKKDEISQVSNAFYTAASRIKRLTDSRTLFIRNLFHELNTPVTKGKLLTEIVEDKKTKTMLDTIFSRLASLLKELGQMEKITSENYAISRKNVRIKDLIDEASDLLFLERPIKTNVTDEMIEVDFSSMSIVFKNLIDNALKYGKNLEIIYQDEQLTFISEGEKLQNDFDYYLEAFSKKEGPSHEGFGLGLYIVNEVLRMHQMGFAYHYETGKNHFTINLKNNF
jgi:two-component system OmpR family sensor kinase